MTTYIRTARLIKERRAKQDHQARVTLAKIVKGHLEESGMTQTDAAEKMIDAPSQVSLVVTGNVRGFSIMRLLRMICALGHNVEINITDTGGKGGKLTISGPR